MLLYELVAGLPPYFSADKSKIMDRVLKGDLKFPNGFSTNLKHLIARLLDKDPAKRLGSKLGIKEI